MKRIFALCLCIVISPMLFALEDADVVTARTEFDASTGSETVIRNIQKALNLTDQSYVGSFVAPDGAIRGLTFDGTNLWAANSGDGNSTFGDKIWKLNASTGAVLGMYDAPGLSSPCGMTWDGFYLWHSDFGTDLVYKIDPATMAVLKTLPAPNGLIGDLAWDGEYLYAAVLSPGMIIKFDTITGTPVDTIYATYSSPNVRPFGLAYLPFSSGQVWTSDGGYGSNLVNEWDIATSTWIYQWPANPASYPCGLAYDPVSGYMWVSCWDTDSIYIWDVGSAAGPAFWDFEDGLQGWTHTNGLPFPYGWDVEPSSYYPAWTPPDAGDSTMWIDSDASGSGTWVQDTTMSPALVPPAGLAWLKYGVGYNWISSGEFLEVGLKYFNGSSWSAVALKTYTEDTGPLWDSVDVSAYGGYDSVQVYFYYDDNNIWAWYLAFDNVGLYAAATVDAATISIDVPGAYVMPATSIDPTATYRNNGASTETFDVYYVIDTSGVNLYSETYSVTVDALAETTVVFPSMTTPGEGTVLDITAYAVLAGDVNPGNDTLTQTTVVQSAFWKVYSNSMPAAVYYHACVYSDVTGTPTVYSLGGYTAAAISTIYEFDCNTETWSTAAATLNHAVWRQAAATVGGRIYVFGGYDASTVVQNYNQEYDPVAGTVTDKTPMPTARQFLGAVAWQDTLIYVIGGQSTGYYDIVEIYNPATDSWTNGTALPITNRSFAIGISGDTIYITGGYNSSAYVSATYIGVIDPVDPTVITWTAGPMIPTGPSTQAGRSRVQGACVEGKFYFTCGDDHGVEAHDTWYYDPADAQWHQTLDKPTAISNTQCAVYVPVLDGGTFFCPGGYNTATSSGTNAVEGLVNLSTGIEENPLVGGELASFGFAPMRNPTRDPMISYATSLPGRVVLKVYDGAGRLIQTLVNSELPAGVKTVHWDTRAIANGVYFLRLEAENNSATQKMILVK
jgi:hypothetical protein